MASNGVVEEGKPVARLQIYSSSASGVSSFWKEKYERDAKKYWDIFYKRHQDKFFKDRHYLDKEWGHYFSGAQQNTILEIGCGAGNTVFPLIATYPDIFVYACDFSPRAVDLVKNHKDYTDSHVSAFVCDMTVDDLSDHISPSSVDIVTMIFVLSAVSPEKMPLVLQNVRKVLKPSGYVLFRDYATGDLAQERLICKDQKISENFFVRGDGTRAFYFSNEFLASTFQENGFAVEELGLCCKQVENRSRELVMNRRWVQAVFRASDGINCSSCVEASIQASENSLKNVDDFEIDLSDGIGTDMFGSSDSNISEIIKLKDLSFEIKMLNKEHQHTCKSTGMMLWESARLMASVLERNPAIVSGKRVLELGCGCAGICSMVAARHADLVVATDGDTKPLELLTRNVASNLEPPFSNRLVVKRLEWGNSDHIESIIEVNNNGGFDIIIGTDVTYVAEAISPLFATAKELISSKNQGCGLILCHIVRRVDEPTILSTASKFGFRLVDNWPSRTSSAPSRSIINSWFQENNDSEITIPCTSLNILYFHME